MRFCRRQLSAYQRRSLRTIEIMMGITIGLGILLDAILEKHNLSVPMRYGLAILSIVPVVATIILVARYLRGERDEYVRNLVVESILWGLSAVLVADCFFSFVRLSLFLIPVGNLSFDIFVLTTSARLESKLWRNQ
jgi:hypothetical protein